MDGYSSKFQIIWANLDPNGHMRHTAYNDYAAQVRVNLFKDYGFPLDEFVKRGFGPILFTENTRFMKEIRMGEEIEVNCEVLAMRRNGKIWKFRHRVFNSNNQLACEIEVEGAFLDLKARKVAEPPAEIQAFIKQIPKAEEFKWMDE